MVEGATPLFWTLVRHRGGGAGAPLWSHHLPSPLGGRSLHSDPCGKAEMLKTWTRIVLLNLALIAAGLRAWLSPWPAPGETALLDLVGATDPLVQVTRPVVHQDTPSFEQVRTRIGRLDPVPDHMRQGRLDHLPGMIGLLGCPIAEAGAEPVRHGHDPFRRNRLGGARSWYDSIVFHPRS